MSATRPLKLNCDEVQAAVALVSEARMLFGKRQAAALWRLLPLPAPESFTMRASVSERSAGVLAFMNDSGCVMRKPGADTSAAALYAAYVAWCGTSELPATWCAFGRTLTSLGITRQKVSGHVVYHGLHLTGLGGFTR